jgi:hypothetical protein
MTIQELEDMLGTNPVSYLTDNIFENEMFSQLTSCRANKRVLLLRK